MTKKKGSTHADSRQMDAEHKAAHNTTHNEKREGSEADREQQALKRKAEGLIGDTGQNRNLTGSSTWETLPDPARESKRSSGNH